MRKDKMVAKHMNYLIAIAVFFSQKALGKIEVLPLPQEEQACFDKERVHGDLSQVLGHMVLEKCVYATELLKMHIDTSKFPEPTLKWFQGLIDQAQYDSTSSPVDVTMYRGKRQAGTLTGGSQQQPIRPQQSLAGPQQQFGGSQLQFGAPQMRFGGAQQQFAIPPQQARTPQHQMPNRQQEPQSNFRIRKEYRVLSDTERTLTHRAFQMLKADTTVNPNKFDALGQLHEASVGRGHYGPNFFPWHRLFLLMVENALREKIPSVTLPYWDSTLDSALLDPRSSVLWTPDFFGYGFGFIQDGPFANWDSPYGPLLRSFGQDGALFNWTSINSSLSTSHLANISFPYAKPENNLEEHHVQVHLWVGGFMAPPALAAFDPVFYFLHAYVDLLWELFRNLQRDRAVDPTSDYPRDNNVTGHGWDDTAGLGSYRNYHGMSDHFTTNIYKYQVPPSCTRKQPTCGSAYIRCDTKRKEPRCVSASIFDPIRMYTARGIPMDGSSGIRELRSTRMRSRRKQKLVEQKMTPTEKFIDGSADLKNANTFVLDGRMDPSLWAYIPVTVKYQHRQGESKAMVNDWCDVNKSDMKILIVSDGFNYHGQYKHIQLVNTSSEVTFTSFIGVKQPNTSKDTEVLVSAYDSCGRMCKPSCFRSDKGYVENCTGAIKLTEHIPYGFITHEQKSQIEQMDDLEKEILYKSDVFLTFTCSSAMTDWIW